LPLNELRISNAVILDGKPLAALAADNGFRVFKHDFPQPSCQCRVSPARFPALPGGTIASPSVAETSALRLWPGFIDGKCPPTGILAIQCCHGLLSFVVVCHGDKAEPAGPS
jgi:hypothetical protein